MTPTVELRTRLRKLLGEVIPAGGSDADTRFLNSEIDQLLSDADSLYRAASTGWTIKAAQLQAELGQIEEYSVGQERYRVVNLQTALRSALDMAERYAQLAASSIGSMIIGVAPPEVL
ncbi:MAG: hypothetical protein QME79_13180 [Bacillota bacterium]|nr:hypothetical protein [Bacillota bacterium]